MRVGRYRGRAIWWLLLVAAVVALSTATCLLRLAPGPALRSGPPTATPLRIGTPAATITPTPKTGQVIVVEPAEVAKQVAVLVNAERIAAGIPEMAVSPDLMDIAAQRSQDMADRGYFAHDIPGGGNVGTLLADRGIAYTLAGENISGHFDHDNPAAEFNRLWMASDLHRANRLNPRYTHYGVGVAVDPQGQLLGTEVFIEQR